MSLDIVKADAQIALANAYTRWTKLSEMEMNGPHAAATLRSAANELRDRWNQVRLLEKDAARVIKAGADPLRDARTIAEIYGPEIKKGAEKKESSWRLSIVNMHEVEEQAVPWLWEPYVASGELTTLQGPPGIGKSQVAQYLASQVTRGGSMPTDDGTAVRVPKGPVLWFSLEDHPAYVLKKRLREMGADDTMFKVVDGMEVEDEEGECRRFPVSLQELGVIRDGLERLRPVLCVFDPLQAYLGRDKKLNAAEDTRSLLEPLTALMREFGAAGILVRHMSKAHMRTLLDSGMGSGDISAACRSVLACGARSDEAEADRAMLHIKSNLGPEGCGLGYLLGPFRWTGRTDVTRADLMGRGRREGETKLDKAVAYIESVLRDGPRPSRDLDVLAKEAGHALGTVSRAKQALGILTGKAGKAWWICLPGDKAKLKAIKEGKQP